MISHHAAIAFANAPLHQDAAPVPLHHKLGVLVGLLSLLLDDDVKNVDVVNSLHFVWVMDKGFLEKISCSIMVFI